MRVLSWVGHIPWWGIGVCGQEVICAYVHWGVDHKWSERGE